MKKLLIGVFASLALLVLVAYAGAQGPSFAGTWKTTYGIIDMQMFGNEVNGTYMHGQGRIAGTVDLNGRTLTGTWTETTTEGVVLGSGDIVLTLSSDGDSFTGLIWHGPQSGVGGVWEGTRMR